MENKIREIEETRQAAINQAAAMTPDELQVMREIDKKIEKGHKDPQKKDLGLTDEEQELLEAVKERHKEKTPWYSVDDAFRTAFKLTREYVEGVRSYANSVAEIRSQSEIYSELYISQLIQEAGRAFNTKATEIPESMEKVLFDLKLHLTAKAETLSLTSPEFNTAMNILNTAGNKIDGRTLEQIAEQFKGDVASLRAFKAVADAQGMPGADVFNDLIFDAASEVDKLQVYASTNLFNTNIDLSILGDESLQYNALRDVNQIKFNAVHFGTMLKKLANLANISIALWDTDILKNEDVFSLAARAGAGI